MVPLTAQCDARAVDWSEIGGTWWRLRPASWADEAAIAEYGRGPDPSWIGIAASSPPQRAHDVVQEFVKGAAGDFGLVHLAVLKESDAIIGMIGAQKHGPDIVEIVYGIAPAWRGRGLATEMLTSLTRAAQDQDASRRYELVIDPSNAASRRVAEKSGYRCVGTRDSFVKATGETYEDLLYVPSWQVD
ncbi:GNAT family N-acetyltransferase [Microlunatus elymi]|uniref:GNAT family N-acetyltransferase n=1 Tax=Microlunatus elymi TaxID=2596828 RepID=UPI00143D35E8|nr:GNAT family N-acetyltransferase [Microlunatus elymi]